MRGMDALFLMRAQAENNAWANHRLYEACAKLSPDELHAPRTSFFPTIARTLNHILIVDWYYFDAMTRGGRGRKTLDPEEPFADVEPLRAAQRKADAELVAFTAGLRAAADLDAEVRIERRVHVAVEKLGAVLLHVFQHQVHHRGQVHAMLAGTRAAPPQLDEFFLDEDAPLRARELEEIGLG
jgi:uncharacterized damage-inducible protein DinB